MSLTPDLIMGKQWILNIGAETPDFTTFHPVLKKAKDNYPQVTTDHPKLGGKSFGFVGIDIECKNISISGDIGGVHIVYQIV